MHIFIKMIFWWRALSFDSEEYLNSFDFHPLPRSNFEKFLCPYLYLAPVSVFVSISGTLRFLTSSYFDRLPGFHCVQLTMADLIKISTGKGNSWLNFLLYFHWVIFWLHLKTFYFCTNIDLTSKSVQKKELWYF